MPGHRMANGSGQGRGCEEVHRGQESLAGSGRSGEEEARSTLRAWEKAREDAESEAMASSETAARAREERRGPPPGCGNSDGGTGRATRGR
jgi:hypothetical protein